MTVTTVYGYQGDTGWNIANYSTVYATARAGSGTEQGYANHSVYNTFATPNYRCGQWFSGFDTSSIKDDDISSATFDYYAETVTTGDGAWTLELREAFTKVIYDWPNAFIAGANVGSYSLINSVGSGSITTSQYNSLSVAESFIQKHGVTWLYLFLDTFRLGTTPTGDNNLEINELQSGANGPRLTITHSPSGVGVRNVKVSVISCPTSPTSTGNQDYTADMGDLTPKGAIVMGSKQETYSVDPCNFNGARNEDEDTDTVGRISLGLYDGTNVQCLNWRHSNFDSAGGNETDSNLSSSDILKVMNRSDETFDLVAAPVQFIANGIRLNWTTVDTVIRRFTVILFAGADVSVYVGSSTAATSPGTDITAIGFQPDMVFMMCDDQHTAVGTLADAHISVGISLRNGGSPINHGMAVEIDDGEGTISLSSRFSTAYCCMNITTAGAVTWGITAASYDSSGFSMVASSSSGSTLISYMAIQFANVSLSLIDYTEGTTAKFDETVDVTSLTWRPQAFIAIGGFFPAIDTGYSNQHGLISISWADNDDNQAGNTIFLTDGVAYSSALYGNDVPISMGFQKNQLGMNYADSTYWLAQPMRQNDGYVFRYDTGGTYSPTYMILAIEDGTPAPYVPNVNQTLL